MATSLGTCVDFSMEWVSFVEQNTDLEIMGDAERLWLRVQHVLHV